MIEELPDFSDLVDEEYRLLLTYELQDENKKKLAQAFANTYQRGQTYLLRGLAVEILQVLYVPSDVSESGNDELKIVLIVDANLM